MKKLMLLLPVLAQACSQKETISTDSPSAISVTQTDSSAAPKDPVVLLLADTSTASKAFRVVEGEKIIRTINGDMLPVTLSETFTKPGRQYIIKIKNFQQQQISAAIHPKDSTMNLRFNQIRYADGTYDGPFGRTLSLPVPDSGEVWLLLGRSNMASGNDTGSFSVDIK